MKRSIANLIIALMSIVLTCSGCNQDGCKKFPHQLFTYEKGKYIEILNNRKIDVTEMPEAFDLTFTATGIFKRISVESTDKQCSATIIGDTEYQYNDEGRFYGYIQKVHIDMRQEKSINLYIKFNEAKYKFDNTINFSLIRKENKQ